MKLQFQPNLYHPTPEMAYIAELEKLAEYCQYMDFRNAAYEINEYRRGLINGENFTEKQLKHYVAQVTYYAKLAKI
jgi:hypothetical protein